MARIKITLPASDIFHWADEADNAAGYSPYCIAADSQFLHIYVGNYKRECKLCRRTLEQMKYPKYIGYVET